MKSSITPYPLYERARVQGILESGNALIVAPTATGKSTIGRRIIRDAVKRGEQGIHLYLVPYWAQAREIFQSFQRELAEDGISVVLKIAIGKHTDPLHPEKTDILVCTYELCSIIMRTPALTLGRIIIDDIHLIADEIRGPVLEGLLARIKIHKQPKSICALSAVAAEPERLAKWLDLPLLKGDARDKAVKSKFSCKVTNNLNKQLISELKSILSQGEQALIFCQSKPFSQKLAKDLKSVVKQFITADDVKALKEIVGKIVEDDEDAQELLEYVPAGIAFHHATLSPLSRIAIETAFRDHHLKVLTCTPTLAAGVNLLARLVVIRDIFRTEFIRGLPYPILISTGELLNMLGRAGHPNQTKDGLGIALIGKGVLKKDELVNLQKAISRGLGNPVSSRLPDSFDALMHFILSACADRGIVNLELLSETFKKTLWYEEDRKKISFNRPFKSDIMEDISSFAKVTKDMNVVDIWVVPDGVAGLVKSGSKKYNFSLRLTEMNCSCPEEKKHKRPDVCKHLACAIRHLLFNIEVDDEARGRAVYAAAHLFRKTLDLGTKIREAVGLLRMWRFVEFVPGGFQATPVGILALNSNLDLLLIRTANDRIRSLRTIPTPESVVTWIIEDYFSDATKEKKWLETMELWIKEESEIKHIKLPEKSRGDFDRCLEQLEQLATLYAEVAKSYGKPEIAEVCNKARGCLQYGVAPELIPLITLRIPQLGRARCRNLYDQHNIRNIEDLVNADPVILAGTDIPLNITQQWIETAKRMLETRRRIASLPPEEQRKEIDNYLTTFQVDHLSL